MDIRFIANINGQSTTLAKMSELEYEYIDGIVNRGWVLKGKGFVFVSPDLSVGGLHGAFDELLLKKYEPIDLLITTTNENGQALYRVFSDIEIVSLKGKIAVDSVNLEETLHMKCQNSDGWQIAEWIVK